MNDKLVDDTFSEDGFGRKNAQTMQGDIKPKDDPDLLGYDALKKVSQGEKGAAIKRRLSKMA